MEKLEGSEHVEYMAV